MRRITSLMLCATLLAAPALGLDRCPGGSGDQGVQAASCCTTSCACADTGCGGGDPTLSPCAGDHASPMAVPGAGTLTSSVDAPRSQPVVFSVAHPAAQIHAGTAADVATAFDSGRPALPTMDRPAFQLFCTLII